jgi:hypothetical protein
LVSHDADYDAGGAPIPGTDSYTDESYTEGEGTESKEPTYQ